MSRSNPSSVIVWFRNDLRVGDNPALAAATETSSSVIPLYILEDDLGGASQWWLHHSLAALAKNLSGLGVPLILRRGKPGEILPEVIEETGARAVYWNRNYDSVSVPRDTEIKAELSERGIDAKSFKANLLFEPWEVRTKSDTPFSVFTPFWKAEMALPQPDEPIAPPKKINAPASLPKSDGLDSWGLLPTKPNWAEGWEGYWAPGEDGAKARLVEFLDDGMARYDDRRNRPDIAGTSRLAPHLRFGEISPRQVWHWTHDHVARNDGAGEKGGWSFLREIGWRDFNHNLLFYNPELATMNFRSNFDAFPWREDRAAAGDFQDWSRGRTGYPLVDAGMRELWQTGFMHNRVRMVAASFLIKHLLIDWRRGEAWFRDTLLDACPANNTANWQWVAGCGADAAPYFRIFNPTGQAEKFDPDGGYIRRWVPELAKLPNKYLAAPWEAPGSVLGEAGVSLGDNYPYPIVDHKHARSRALAAYEEIKNNQERGAA